MGLGVDSNHRKVVKKQHKDGIICYMKYVIKRPSGYICLTTEQTTLNLFSRVCRPSIDMECKLWLVSHS